MRITRLFSSNNRITNTLGNIDSNLEELLRERQKIRRAINRKDADNLPA